MNDKKGFKINKNTNMKNEVDEVNIFDTKTRMDGTVS